MVTAYPSPDKVGTFRSTLVPPTATTRILLALTARGLKSPYANDPRRRSPEKYSFLGPWSSMPILASSFDGPSTMRQGHGHDPHRIAPFANGLVHGIARAFACDAHLVIRPDDVWLAITTQFAFFVKGNAEALRDNFVAHEGKKMLELDVTPASWDALDFGAVAEGMAGLLRSNVVDAELVRWLMPGFSTTTSTDRAVAAFVTLGAMQEYFEYVVSRGCGLPSVTLLGEREDWVELASRVEKLASYGEGCARWVALLRVVSGYFLRTFDEPNSEVVKSFWLRCAHRAGEEGSASGLATLSGWLTAFVAFDDDGAMAEWFTDESLRQQQEAGLGAEPTVGERERLVLDGVVFPIVDSRKIAKSVLTLPLKLVDLEAGLTQYATAIAGSVGMSVTQDQTTVQPLSGWWIVQEFEEQMEGQNVQRDLSSNDSVSSVASRDTTVIESEDTKAVPKEASRLRSRGSWRRWAGKMS